MKEPAPCDDEHNTLLVWAWSYFEYHDFLPIGENWGRALLDCGITREFLRISSLIF
jgi:hypothetical protein